MVSSTKEKELSYQEVGAAKAISESTSQTTKATEQLSEAEENDLAGDSEDDDEKITIDPNLRLDLKQKKPTTTVASRSVDEKGSVKLGLVLCGVGSLVAIALWFSQQFQPKANYANRKMPTPREKKPEIDFSKPPKVDYQAKYAFKDQQVELDNFDKSDKSDRETESKAVEEKTSVPTTEIQSTPQPTPIINQPIINNNSRKRRRIDPIKLYARATSMGLYGSLNQASASTSSSNDVVVQSQNTGTPKRAKISLTVENYDKQLPIGSKTKGVLLDPISGMDGESLQDRNYIVEIEENLSSPSGEVILGAGTQLICKVTSLSSDGYLQLTPIALQMISQSTRSIVRNLTPGQILINADNGRLLKAQVRKPDTLPQDVMAAMLSGASSAAQIMNRPRSRRTHVAGGFTETIDNGEANVGIAALGGFSDSMSQRMERRVEAEKEWLSKNPAVFFLQAGTKVEIYINQAFSL